MLSSPLRKEFDNLFFASDDFAECEKEHSFEVLKKISYGGFMTKLQKKPNKLLFRGDEVNIYQLSLFFILK